MHASEDLRFAADLSLVRNEEGRLVPDKRK